MATEVQTREELHRLIDEMSDDEVAELADIVNMLLDDGEASAEELAIIEEAMKERERGQAVPFDEVRGSKEA